MNPSNYQYQGVGPTVQQGQNVLSSLDGTSVPVPPPVQTPPQGNWLERLLPTAGSVLGGIAGAFIPGLGETGVGEVGGATAGSALGQQLENALTGSKGSTAVSALEGGLGQVAGMGIAKGIGAASGALGKVATKGATAADDAAYTAPFKGIENTAVAKQNDLNGTAQLMQSLGVEGTPQAWQQAASVGTGRQGLGAMTGALDNIVADSGQLPSDGIIGRVNAAFQNAGIDPTQDKDASIVLKNLNNGISQGTTDVSGNPITGALRGTGAPTGLDEAGNITEPEGFTPSSQGPRGGNQVSGTAPYNPSLAKISTSEQVDGTSLMKTLQDLDGQIAPYHNPNVQLTVQDASKLQGLQNAKAEIENTLYGNGIDKAVANYTVDDATAKQILDAAGGNQQLADYITNGINNAKSGSELRAAQAPLVRASKLGVAANFQSAGQLPGTLEGQMTQMIDKATGELIPQPVQQAASLLHPGAGLVAKGANAIGTKGAGLGSNLLDKVPDKVVTLLAQLGAHAPSLGSQPTTGVNMTTGDNSMNPFQTQAAASPGLGSDLILASLGGNSGLESALAGQVQRSQQANAGSSLLQGAEGAYGAAGGGQGLGSGLLAQISSYIPGTAAYQYHQQMGAVATAISKATGIDPNSVLAMLPSLMAGQQGAQQDFGSLQTGVNAMQAPQAVGGSVLSGL